MQRTLRSIIILFVAAALFSACSRTPNHMRYIPKDAVVVAGINIKSLGKKIAWNAITGSKLFKEMQQRLPEKNAKDAISGIEKAGIDVMNTFYVYVKTDTRFNGGNRITGLVPLSDAGLWEAYVKRVFPNSEIKQHGDRKEASLGSDMYVGWNKDLLIVINMMSVNGLDDASGQPNVNVSSNMAKSDIATEMENAFTVSKDNSINTNKNFLALENAGHDVTFWLNYEQLMTQYSGNMAERVGVALSNALWKDAAFASGFDFKKGKITGDMNYYVSDSLKEVSKELGATNISSDMIDRLPRDNFDMLFAMHLSPKGLKGILEKTGLIGLANVGVSNSGMTLDNMLDAFTGDMAFSMNDFTLRTEMITDSFMGQAVTHKAQKADFSMSYVIKIHNKDQFHKIVQLAKDNGLKPGPDNSFAFPITAKDSVYILMNDEYLVASNKKNHAAGFLGSTFKSQKMPGEISQVTSHPLALFLDIKQMFNNVDLSVANSAQDSMMITESKKLLNNFAVSGGEFKNNSFEYHLDVNFVNTDENAIIQLMDYGMKMNDADKLAAGN